MCESALIGACVGVTVGLLAFQHEALPLLRPQSGVRLDLPLAPAPLTVKTLPPLDGHGCGSMLGCACVVAALVTTSLVAELSVSTNRC